jgi:hypothetical protein
VSESSLPPAGLTWSEYVERWVGDCGGWLPLADQLIHRAGDRVEVPSDPQTVERGLRRLAQREHKPGGQYGRWMMRFFGVTPPLEQWVRWLGTYHARFADLPSGLRLEQLALWNRPPVSESPLACWIHIGIASAHHSRLDIAACEHWLARAERQSSAAGTAAPIEIALLRAELATSRDDHALAEQLERAIEALLGSAQLLPTDELPYRARLAAVAAARFTRPPSGVAPDVHRARACYAAIPDTAIPFVAFRKSVGLAYCAWKLGDLDEATRLAQRAVDEAGDGGLMRMRVMALNMLSRILEGPSAAAVNERARRMAMALEDEDLLRRVGFCAPAMPA